APAPAPAAVAPAPTAAAAPAGAPPAAPTPAEQTLTVTPQVATADSDTAALYDWLGPKEIVKVQPNAAKVSHASKRFQISAGGYIKSRGMTFDYDPDADGGPPEYPGQNVKGLDLQASVYPWPRGKMDQDNTGLGFSLEVAHSVGSVVSAQDDT